MRHKKKIFLKWHFRFHNRLSIGWATIFGYHWKDIHSGVWGVKSSNFQRFCKICWKILAISFLGKGETEGTLKFKKINMGEDEFKYTGIIIEIHGDSR